MSIRDDLVVIDTSDLSDDDKRLAKYRTKTRALIDVIKNGAGPLAPLLRHGYAHKGVNYIINRAWSDEKEQLIFDVVVNGFSHTVIIVNPPLIPRAPTGDERRDMLQAVREMLEDLPTDETL